MPKINPPLICIFENHKDNKRYGKKQSKKHQSSQR
jgi:hypothetical protein